MTPREIAEYTIKNGPCFGTFVELAKAYLDLEKRMHLANEVIEGAIRISWQVKCIGEPELNCDSCKFHEALEKFESAND